MRDAQTYIAAVFLAFALADVTIGALLARTDAFAGGVLIMFGVSFILLAYGVHAA